MSLIAFPDVPLQEFRIDITTPNVIHHDSVFTAKENIFSRGNLYFAGRIGWARRHQDRIDEISKIEAFLTECYGPVNTFKIPIPRDQTGRFDGSADLTISAVTTNGTFDSEFTATAGLLLGDWVNFGDRLHKIVKVDGTSYKVVPGILEEETTMKWHSPIMLARITQDKTDLARTGGWAGPWQIPVREAL